MERKDKSNSAAQGVEELKVVFSMFVENTGSFLITLADELEEIKIGNKVMKTLPKGRVYNLFADDSLEKGESIPRSLVRETGEVYTSSKGDIYRLEWSV